MYMDYPFRIVNILNLSPDCHQFVGQLKYKLKFYHLSLHA